MAKFQDIRALAKQQLQAVTKNGECWKAFLHTAAIAYNYNFPNQLLIYCQNPTATAVADMEYWNKEAGRQVKRGAHGIPILDVKKEMMALRYLFDISDTIPQARTDKGLPWAVTDQNWKPVWDKIIRDNQADSIQNALLMLFKNILAVCRSRNISCDIILQSKSQIQSLYKDDWEGMIGNCDSLIYLGGNEYATFEWLSKYIGKMTERTKSQSIGRGSRGSSSDSYQLAARDLCSPDEIRRMDDGDCLVLLRSEPPVIDHKFDLMRHPNVKLTPDGGAAPYRMPDDYAQTAQTISPDVVTGLTEPAITEVMYDEIQKIMEEIHNEQERNL